MVLLTQEEEEQEVFRAFLKARGFPSEKFLFENRRVPEPDILWWFEGEDAIAYELSEVIDPISKEELEVNLKTRDAMYEFLDKWDSREEFRKKFGDADLCFRFPEGVPLREREKGFRKLFSRLMEIDNDFEGDCTGFVQEVFPDIEEFVVNRGLNGPSFDLPMAGFLEDPFLSRISKKFAKEYSGSCKKELILWVRLHPIKPLDTWVELLEAKIRKKIFSSPFSKVWVLDYSSQEISFSCPELGESRSFE